MNTLDLKVFADLMAASDHYLNLPYGMRQLAPSQRETIIEWWDSHFNDVYLSDNDLLRWKSPNIHVIEQMWSNTSGGWEGIGGSAMTNSYTFVIENLNFNFACVYYGKELAYIAKIDARWNNTKDLSLLPGMSSCKKQLSIIYKRER